MVRKTKPKAKPKAKKQHARKKPAKEQLAVDVWKGFEDALLDCTDAFDDASTDSEHDFMDEVGDGIDSVVEGEEEFASDCDANPTEDPPLLVIVRSMLKENSEWTQLVENLSILSRTASTCPLGAGSGCTGSGLDWHAIKVVSEVFLLFVYQSVYAQFVLLCRFDCKSCRSNVRVREVICGLRFVFYLKRCFISRPFTK